MSDPIVRGLVLVWLALLAGCQPPAPAAPDVVEPAADEAQAPAPLDLSREHLQGLDASTEDGGADAPALLPDMFADKKDRKVKVGGSLLTDEEAVDLRDTIDGVELEVEVRTR